MTCLVLSLGLARDMYLKGIYIRKRKMITGTNDNLPDLHELGSSQYTLYRPFGEFAAVVLHLRGNDCSSLRI
jgi:hypothetical protein